MPRGFPAGAAAYAWRVNDFAAFFNSLIEKIVYETSERALGRWSLETSTPSLRG
jgi:hypothetical protein